MWGHDRLSRLLLWWERDELGAGVSIVLGNVPLSNAAAITSAGKSKCTPSTYVNASSGEYAGGSLCGTGLGVASACRCISLRFGVGGSGLCGESGGGCT